jgi:hypothetical protein
MKFLQIGKARNEYQATFEGQKAPKIEIDVQFKRSNFSFPTK